MEYKILESHIVFNHPYDDYIISIAIESVPGYWKAYYNQVPEVPVKSMLSVAASGKKQTKHRAKEIFTGLAAQKIADKLICEN
ncbi:hypothetical protein SAMN06265379_11413 [Saccharicrinis carchari]|uniref:Uncharacterized protein n=2 Tax=Saccharicrinis carchari TaxID=1168039 RepID=A0A521F3P0_SACCC|nr:hypothetical protein SAMN06265379_11413 [Saccharicrinis carchari]